MSAHIDRAAAVLDACVAMLPDLENASDAYVERERNAAAAGTWKAPYKPELEAWQSRLAMSKAVAKESTAALLEMADAIGASRDQEALSRLGATLFGAALKILLTATGIEVAKDAVDLASALADMDDAGRAAKYRREQAKDSSAFLHWIDAVASLGMAWLVRAEYFILASQGKTTASPRTVARRVAARIA